jgi:rsbT co-antagonist protein RsbR
MASTGSQSVIQAVLRKYEQDLLVDWVREQKLSGIRESLVTEAQLRSESTEFLKLFIEASRSASFTDIQSKDWERVREFLGNLSRSRGLAGFSPSETATFVFSFKKPLFTRLRKESDSADKLADEMWAATELLDKFGLYTTEVYQKSREELIMRQQSDMLELSTPVVQLWDGILALPMIGTLDSSRTSVVMETLLQRIVETRSEIAIIDITGVPTVDTLVAQHLLKTVTAARLMGAECIISGIRPQIAATIVHLGVELNGVITKANLADAFQLAVRRRASTAQRPGLMSQQGPQSAHGQANGMFQAPMQAHTGQQLPA